MENTPEQWINEKFANDGFVSSKQIIAKFHYSLDQSAKKLSNFYDSCPAKHDLVALYQMCAVKNDDSSATYQFDLVREKKLKAIEDSGYKIVFLKLVVVGRLDADVVKEYFDEKLDDDETKWIGNVRYPNKRPSAVVDVAQSSKDSILSPKKVAVKNESLENSKKIQLPKKQKQEMSSFFQKSSDVKAHADNSAAVTTENKVRSNENSSMTAVKNQRKTQKPSKTFNLDPNLFSADSSPESSPVKKATVAVKETECQKQSKKRQSKAENTGKKKKTSENVSRSEEKEEIENDIDANDSPRVPKANINDEGPIKRQKMVHNTYLDEDGYLVTMKESRTEVVPKSDSKIENKAKSTSIEMKNGHSESSVVDQKSSARNGKPSDGKTVKKDSKTVGKAQSTLTSFFKK